MPPFYDFWRVRYPIERGNGREFMTNASDKWYPEHIEQIVQNCTNMWRKIERECDWLCPHIVRKTYQLAIIIYLYIIVI